MAEWTKKDQKKLDELLAKKEAAALKADQDKVRNLVADLYGVIVSNDSIGAMRAEVSISEDLFFPKAVNLDLTFPYSWIAEPREIPHQSLDTVKPGGEPVLNLKNVAFHGTFQPDTPADRLERFVDELSLGEFDEYVSARDVSRSSGQIQVSFRYPA